MSNSVDYYRNGKLLPLCESHKEQFHSRCINNNAAYINM